MIKWVKKLFKRRDKQLKLFSKLLHIGYQMDVKTLTDSIECLDSMVLNAELKVSTMDKALTEIEGVLIRYNISSSELIKRIAR